MAASLRRPALLGPALVAAGLAVGTKPTALPLTALVVIAGLLFHRGKLVRLRPALASAAVIGGLVGATWYLRNLIEHGSPLWPFAGGDPQPPLFARLDHSLLQRPRTTLSSQARRYFESLGGAPVLFAAAVVAPALVRRPLVAWGALATACSVLLYAAGPVTGRPNVDELAFLPATTVRYLLPAIAAACATLALTAGSRRGRLPAQAVLAVATGLSLVATWPFGYPDGPSLVLAAAGALGGAGAAALVSRVGIRPVLAGAGLIAAVALTGASSGLVLRHAKLNANRFSGVSLELERRSGFKRSQAPVATNSSPLATLAGDRLDRRVDLIPARETCAEVERKLRGSWIILSTSPPLPTRAGRLVCPPRGLPAAWPPAGRTPAPELSGYAHDAMSELAVSVIVPCHEAGRTLPRLLGALRAQTLDPARFEVVLVGHGLAAQDGARVVDAPLESGPALKRNLAAQAARGDIFAFTDADCVPEADWLERGLAAFTPDIGFVQGRTLPVEGQSPAPLTHWIVVAEDHGLYETCNILYRRELFRSLGGFTERFFRRYGLPFGEDADLGWRARRAGAGFRFEPGALVRHPVEPIGLGRHLRLLWLARGFPELAGELPELREAFLYRRWFLSPRSARFVAALAGLVLARRMPAALLLALPYARLLRRDPAPALSLLSDAVTAAALTSGSVRARRLVA